MDESTNALRLEVDSGIFLSPTQSVGVASTPQRHLPGDRSHTLTPATQQPTPSSGAWRSPSKSINFVLPAALSPSQRATPGDDAPLSPGPTAPEPRRGRMYFHAEYAPKTQAEMRRQAAGERPDSGQSNVERQMPKTFSFSAFAESVTSTDSVPVVAGGTRERKPPRHLRPAMLALVEAEDAPVDDGPERRVRQGSESLGTSPGASMTTTPLLTGGTPGWGRGRRGQAEPASTSSLALELSSSGGTTPSSGMAGGGLLPPSGNAREPPKQQVVSRHVIRPRGWSRDEGPTAMPSVEQLCAEHQRRDVANRVNLLNAPREERLRARAALVPGAASVAATKGVAHVTDAGQAMHFRAIRERHARLEAEQAAANEARQAAAEERLERLKQLLKDDAAARTLTHGAPLGRPRPSLAIMKALGGTGTGSPGAQRRVQSPNKGRSRSIANVPHDAVEVFERAGLEHLLHDARSDYGGGGGGASSTPQPTPDVMAASRLTAGGVGDVLGRSATMSSTMLPEPTLQRGQSGVDIGDLRRRFSTARKASQMSARSESTAPARPGSPGPPAQPGPQLAPGARSGETSAYLARLARDRAIEDLRVDEERARAALAREERKAVREGLRREYALFHDAAVAVVDAVAAHQQEWRSSYTPWMDAADAQETPPRGVTSSPQLPSYAPSTRNSVGSVNYASPGASRPSSSGRTRSNVSAMKSITVARAVRRDSRVVAIANATARLGLPDAGGPVAQEIDAPFGVARRAKVVEVFSPPSRAEAVEQRRGEMLASVEAAQRAVAALDESEDASSSFKFTFGAGAKRGGTDGDSSGDSDDDGASSSSSDSSIIESVPPSNRTCSLASRTAGNAHSSASPSPASPGTGSSGSGEAHLVATGDTIGPLSSAGASPGDFRSFRLSRAASKAALAKAASLSSTLEAYSAFAEPAQSPPPSRSRKTRSESKMRAKRQKAERAARHRRRVREELISRLYVDKHYLAVLGVIAKQLARFPA